MYMATKFSIEEIKIYLESQDSLGDIHYNLSEENIVKANTPTCDNCDEEITGGSILEEGTRHCLPCFNELN
jgi:hypothetical protein